MNATTAPAATSLVRQERTRQGLSIDELARRAGIERSRLGRYERGYSKLHPQELRRVGKILRVPMRTLKSVQVTKKNMRKI